MHKKYLGFIAASLLAAGLLGCGSSGESGGDQTQGQVGEFGTDPATGIQLVGAGTCINCHQTLSFSAEEVALYLQGAHVVHSTEISQSSSAECLTCHDPIGDGPTVAPLLDAANVPAGGLAAVGCENCHGAGGEHFGVGPIPMPSPDFNTCGECHDADYDPAIPFHTVEADNILEDYIASPHHEGRVRNSNVCVKCHTDEGAREYVAIDNTTGLFGVAVPVPVANPIQCRTCHDPHAPDTLLEAATNSESAQYATCTNCHQDHDAIVGTTIVQPQGSTSSDGGSSDGELIYHAARLGRIITDTHSDDPATPAETIGETPGMIEGYVMDPTDEDACRNCHNIHTADITINEQWAESAHGGFIAQTKFAAAEAAAASVGDETIEQTNIVKAAAVIDDEDISAPAWTHYNWDAQNRQSCQRCHTSTGLMNFLEADISQDDADAANDVTYDPASNDFTHLSDWSQAADGTVTASPQNEMLFCWGCHESVTTGQLRNPGQLTLDFEHLVGPEQDPSGARSFVVLPDKGQANVCGACHGGRGNDTSIRDSYAADSLSSRFAGHHAPTAGSLYAEIVHTGFEFAGRDYSPPAFFQHDDILVTGASPETGDGPCVGCHMAGTANHVFEAVDKAPATGEITAIRNQALCVTCHPMDAATLNSLKAGFEDARAIFNELATNVTPNYKGLDITDAANRTTAILSINDYGTFQNVLYMNEEPCIYVHNDIYGRRLIIDSIDWLDNGVLDGTITIDAAAHPQAATWLRANAAGVVTR